MIWIILLILLISLLGWVLFGPVKVQIITETDRYQLILPGIFKASVIPSENLFHIRGWIFLIPFRFYPFKDRKEKVRRSTRQSKRRNGLKKRSGKIQILPELIRSFRIRKLHLDLDTEDSIVNAWLVPVFSVVNTENIQMRVNFEGTFSLALDLRTHLGALLWIFIKSNINHSLTFKFYNNGNKNR
jgi:hypothetical protein